MTQAAVVCTRTRRRSNAVDSYVCVCVLVHVVDRRRRRLTRARIIAGGGRCSDIRRRRVRTFGVYVLIIYVTRPSLVVVVARIHHDVRDLIRIMPFVHNTHTHTHTHTHTALARRPVRAPCSRSDCRSVGPPTPTPHPRVRIMPAQGLASRVDRRIARSAFVDDDDDGARRGRVASRRHPR